MDAKPVRVALICGSVREGRFGPVVASWMRERIEARGDIELDVVDLAEVRLPLTQQDKPVPYGDYTSPEVRVWAERVGAADAFVVVTPEYNRGYPAALKLAIDSVNPEWRAKAVGFVSYGGVSGGLRAVEQLRPVFAELRAVTVRETVGFAQFWERFDDAGRPKDADGVNRAADVLLDELSWWARALRQARAEMAYPNV
ncbi:NADPH-dependent FMN reductase [Nocardia mexicana]|uniref:NAD(P)H-dependent FMN reductase n=1 Tax=Nocardia mexicana TaxID=279262 RepID=A0A370GGV5_9NOCA|nr:NAD(P)H-dependent oxidoreductase [Nocardia mexicana]RDI42476.1 NAD(P)H-dependent FMN reductase [Nocardia mexicana]